MCVCVCVWGGGVGVCGCGCVFISVYAHILCICLRALYVILFQFPIQHVYVCVDSVITQNMSADVVRRSVLGKDGSCKCARGRGCEKKVRC